MQQRRVVVTGLGLITPLGTGVQRVWDRLLQAASGIRAIKPEDLPESHRSSFPDLKCKIAGLVNKHEFIDYDWAPSPEVIKMLPKDHTHASLFATGAAAEALEDARLRSVLPDRERDRAGVSMGVGLPAVWQGGRAGVLTAQGRPHQLPDQLLARLLLSSPGAHIAKQHKLGGPLKSHTTACSASAHAIGDAWRHVRDGDADVMIAGGAESCIDAITISGFSGMRAMTTSWNKQPQAGSRPFDSQRSGFVMGEGSGCLILEELEHARARGARMYAEVRACGMTGDAHHAVQPDPGGHGAIAAMQQALHIGSIPADRVVYVNAHAASTPQGDALEQLAISKVFGERATSQHTNSPPLLVSSTKGATGHLLGAAGAVEAVFTVLTLAHRAVPPTLNLQVQKPKTLAHIVGFGKAKRLPHGHVAVMSNSFGFGGTNAALLFATPPQYDDW